MIFTYSSPFFIKVILNIKHLGLNLENLHLHSYSFIKGEIIRPMTF